MNLTFRQLQVFEAAARLLSFTRAAAELHMTQPAVSMQIKQLEHSVGIPLFEHLGKKTFLTHAGKEMYQYSRRFAALYKEVASVMDALKGEDHGHLDIAVASTANYFSTRVLANFCKQFPHVTFSLEVTNRAGLLKRLEFNDRDFVIMGKPPDNMELQTHAFMKNPLVIIAHPSHPLVGKKRISLTTIQRETFVVREQGSGTRIAMERFFKDNGFRLKTGMELNSSEAIKQAVEADLGLGIVSLHTLELELQAQRLEILDVQAFPIMRDWYLVYAKGKRLSKVAMNFQQYVLSEAKNALKLPVSAEPLWHDGVVGESGAEHSGEND